jgi:uncharacterized protein (DUF2236 family)
MTATLDPQTDDRAVGAEPFDIRPYLSPLAAGLPGAANVIMQLSWPAVGYGVMESRVDSGSAMKHPVKRARTTFTYLAVALLGTDQDRRAFRTAVDRQHAQVRSTRSSPVRYNAMDPRLQLWVAACLYYGLADLISRLHGPLDEAVAERLYSYSSRLGTTLQVKPEMWPPDRAAFARYWEDSLARVRIDGSMRDYLMRLVRLENLPRPVQRAFGPANVFWTTGFLPPLFREQMALAWTDSDEDRFTSRLRRVGRMEAPLPPALKALPLNLLLWDMRRRVRQGHPLV